MNRSLLARYSKYSLAFIGFVIGTEIVYNYAVRLNAWLGKGKAECQEYFRVIFFPDDGILALNNCNHKQSLNGEESSFNKQCHDLPIPNNQTETKVPCNSVVAMESVNRADSSTLDCTFLDMNAENSYSHLDKVSYMKDSCSFPHPSESSFHANQLEFTYTNEGNRQGPLCKSTSLIHMIRVLESAKKSLMVCVYLLSCSDLVEAIIHAKERGVKVRVILDKGMSSVSNLSPLLQNRIPVRYSKPSQMMHNKFAVIDFPEVMDSTPLDSQEQNTKHRYGRMAKTLQSTSNISFNASSSNVVQKHRQHSQESRSKNDFQGILMTGSFNWTWSGVVSNHENVIITNNKNLVITFAEEFEKLWNAFEFVPPRNN